MSSFVLDASAVLASLRSEPGSEAVDESMNQSVISSVNLSEVVAKLTDGGMSVDSINALLPRLSFETIPFDADQAYDAGILRQATRHIGLSLGDRCCLSLARSMNLPVLTADNAWRTLSVSVDVTLIR